MARNKIKFIIKDHLFSNNVQLWFKYDQNHRHDHDRPQYIEQSIYRQWCQYNVLHRLYGPARIWENGIKEYWIYGEHMNEQQFNKRIKKLSNNE